MEQMFKILPYVFQYYNYIGRLQSTFHHYYKTKFSLVELYSLKYLTVKRDVLSIINAHTIIQPPFVTRTKLLLYPYSKKKLGNGKALKK